MEELIIEGTKGTPTVQFYPNGNLRLEGKSLPEDPQTFYTPILDWVKKYDNEKIVVDIRLEYMNTSSSKQMYTFLINISENTNIKDIVINWYYEENDEDGLEAGKDFESMTKIPFVFHEYAEIIK